MTTSKARLQANLLSGDGTVKIDKIGDNTITSDKIATGTIASIDMADSAVTSLKIANGSIATVDLADGAVTPLKLSDDVREFQFVNYIADSAQTTFAADSNPGTDNGLIVFLNGVFQTSGENYTRANANVVFSEPLDSGDQVDIIRTSLVSQVITPADGSITPDKFSNQLQNVITDRFTGDGTTSLFTLSEQPYNANGLLVFVDGVNQIPDVNYSVDSSAITFGSAPDSDADVFVTHFTYRLGEYEITPSAGTVTEAAFADPFLNDGYLVVKSSSSNPANPDVGQMYYNDSDNVGYFWNGNKWVDFTNVFTAEGGTETTYTEGGINYKSHTFTSSGTFVVTQGTSSTDILVVAGGGGGGCSSGGAGAAGGGGGAGGAIVATDQSFTTGSYSIVVGAGGAGSSDNTAGSGSGADGNNSSITSFTAIAGGGGGSRDTAGRDGGSGGGTNGGHEGLTAGSGTSGQGNDGGVGGNIPSPSVGGGGGGFSAAGESTNFNSTDTGGDGGAGLANTYQDGTSKFYAGGGGGGGGFNAGGAGGSGVGADGADGDGVNTSRSISAPNNATANRGGGGGGSAGTGNGSNGASGIVIIRYAL